MCVCVCVYVCTSKSWIYLAVLWHALMTVISVARFGLSPAARISFSSVKALTVSPALARTLTSAPYDTLFGSSP